MRIKTVVTVNKHMPESYNTSVLRNFFYCFVADIVELQHGLADNL